MAKIYYDKDADVSRLKGRTVAIIGYGSQGHAHALNLRDSGIDVVVGLPAGSRSRAKAEADGAHGPHAARGVAREADMIMILTPDTGRRASTTRTIAPALRPGKTLMFAHGFNIRFGTIDPPAGRRRLDGRAEGAGPPRPRALQRRAGDAGPRRRPPRRERQGPRERPRLRQGPRLHPRRRPRDDVHRGDRDRPLRRAGRPLRRRLGPREGGLRDAGRRPATSPRSPTSSASTS